MYRLILAIIFLLVNSVGAAQTKTTLSVDMQAEAEVPADIIHFNITINAEADSPQEAYKTQQQREELLVKQLKQHRIRENQIQFEPVSIQKVRRRRDQEPAYRTRQRVILSIEDFSIYEQIQITLIEHGFDNFNGRFSSTKLESGKTLALQKAIEKAQNRAKFIARETGVTLGKVIHIDYGQSSYRITNRSRIAKMESESGLLNIEQEVTVRASISIKYLINS